MAIYAFDIETTSLNPRQGSVLSVSWCGTDLIPHSEPWTPKIKAFTAGLLGNPKNTIITQNAAFDYSWMLREKLVIKAARQDTMIASHVIEPNQPAGLGSLVQRYLLPDVLKKAGINIEIDYDWKNAGPTTWIKDNKKWFKAQFGRPPHMGDVPAQLLHSYAKKDALYTLLVWFAMLGYLTKTLTWSYNLDMAMLPIILGMKCRGIPLDIPFCRQKLKVLRKQQREFLRTYRIEKVGPKALKEVIFPKLGIRLQYKTEKGNWKFDEKTIRRYQVQYPKQSEVLERIIQYRKAKQSDSTYYSGYIYHSYHGKIYPTFNLTNAKTGRFSSSSPNIQNVKKRGEERKAFLVRPGFINIYWDYDQIELRLLAHYSKDKQLLNIFKRGIDPHAHTAVLMGITPEMMKSFLSGTLRRMEPRAVGKNLNFSFWYGMGVEMFSLNLGLTMKEGQKLYDLYKRAYPDATAWSDRLIQTARSIGYVEDIFGKRYYPDDRYSYYKLINYLIQGTAAQVMKIGMLRTQRVLHKDKRNLSIIRELPLHTMYAIQLLTVHDEIGIEFEDKRSLVLSLVPKITKALTITDTFKVPLTVGIKWTRTNWGEVKEIEDQPMYD